MIDIGIDLDNTIIDYDDVFAPVAEELGLLPAASGLSAKEAVKTRLRNEGGDEAWMRLQGQVYGRYISMARPHPGCQAFIRSVRESGARVGILSHKTRRGHFDPAGIDLWEAALGWLDDHGFFAASGLDPGDVHFEPTREAKVRRIGEVGCRVFIDDLPEVLNHPDFPPDVERLWFARGRDRAEGGGLRAFYTWAELLDNAPSMSRGRPASDAG